MSISSPSPRRPLGRARAVDRALALAVALLCACRDRASAPPPPTAASAEPAAPAAPAAAPAAARAERVEPADTRPASSPAPLVASDDDEADDGKTPRKLVRGTLRMPGDLALPAHAQIVGLRRVQLAGVASVRERTWRIAPRAPVDAQGRFELRVPGHWNSLVLYADAPTLWDHPLLHIEHVPPAHALELVAKPCAALSGVLAPQASACASRDAGERIALHLALASGARVCAVDASGAFEFARVPSNEPLLLTLESTSHAPLEQRFELAAGEARVLPALGVALARRGVRVVDARGARIAGARVVLTSVDAAAQRTESRERTTDADGHACVPLALALPRTLRVEPPQDQRERLGVAQSAHVDAAPSAHVDVARSAQLDDARRALLGVELALDRGTAPLDGDDWVAVLPDARVLRVDVRLPDGAAAARTHGILVPDANALSAHGCIAGPARHARADESGALVFDAVYDVPYTLELWGGMDAALGDLRATLELAPRESGEPASRVPLTRIAASDVELRILTADHNPWPAQRGRFVVARELATEFEDSSAGDGASARLRLFAGRWRISVRDEKAGGASGSVELELPRDAAHIVEIALTR